MRNHWHSKLATGFAITGTCLCNAALGAEPVDATGVFAVVGSFMGPDSRDDEAKDLSGLACTDRADASGVVCMAVNDENKNVQFVVLGDGKLLVRSTIELIGDKPASETLGAAPVGSSCPGAGGFKEFDGEAVAYQAPYFYVAGSHGCGRKNGKFRLSSFILARIKVSENGPILDENGAIITAGDSGTKAVETTYRLGEALRAAPTVGPFFAKDLNTQNGLNIEGIVLSGERLIAGLRAPSINGKAYAVVANRDRLFADDSEAIGDIQEVALPLGENAGIRDLTALPDGRLLILAGAAQEADVPHSVWITSLSALGEIKLLAELKRVANAKAEAITVLDSDTDQLNLLVLFDGLVDGGPRHYAISPAP